MRFWSSDILDDFDGVPTVGALGDAGNLHVFTPIPTCPLKGKGA